MSASRLVVESTTSRPYSTALLDAAVERQARRNSGASPAGPPPPDVSAAQRYREAHLESVTSRTPPSNVRQTALQTLGLHLASDENFASKLSKDARRALAGVDYLTEREQHVLAAIDSTAWGKLADASKKLQMAISKRALAGLPQGMASGGDLLGGYDPQGGGAYGFGNFGNLAGGNEHPSPGTPYRGGRGSDLSRGFGDDGSGFEASGQYGSGYGRDAGAPSSPTGGRLFGSPRDPAGRASGFVTNRGGPASELDGNSPAGRPTQPSFPRNPLSPPSPPVTANRPSGTVVPGGTPAEQAQYEKDLAAWARQVIEASATLNRRDIAKWKKEIEAQPPSAPPPVEPPPEPPPNPTGNPNPEDPGGPRPAGPWSRYLPSAREAMPNPEDPRGPGPVGPWSRGQSRGAYVPSGREAVPNPEAPGGPGPVGPWSRAISRAYGAFGGEAMPDPNADPGHGGPVGPAT